MRRTGDIALWLLVLSPWACGTSEPLPFGGRQIVFRSQYVHFPSDFGVTIVLDTMPQEEVCPLLRRYQRPPLPFWQEHYSLIMTLQSAAAGEDVTVDLNDRGPAGDVRSVGLGLYPPGARSVPPGGFGVDAGGTIILRELERYRRAAGSYHLRFRTGETLRGDFAVQACPG
ncbi:MAG: hypothetical protein RMK29_04755 [Myxococcales bacterium]|nr:hypothetical protein [Myxococcota bacterium]MDW8280999.1 hypothetical protein [Myxococcales bacterium]